MKTVLIGAGSDLGVHIDGARLAPKILLNDLKEFYKGQSILLEQDHNIIKSRNLADKRKNEVSLLNYNKSLYNLELEYLKEKYFPITIGGDHSITIASCLADARKNENIGIIYLGAHTDYNTFETTATGNIHELTLATINGYKCNELKTFHTGSIISSKNTVIVGARNIKQKEKDNIRYSGATVFTTEDIKKQGIENIMNQAFAIAGEKTNGIHISFSLDLISPDIAAGVSTPEENGITEEEGMKVLDEILKRIEQITVFDLVELNPTRDIERKTEQIAVNMLAKTIMTAEKNNI